MPNQMPFGIPREIPHALRPTRFYLLGFLFILFFCAARNAVAAPVFTSPTTASGIVGSPFWYQMTTTNGWAWRYGAVGLPPGLAVNTRRGSISGTPTAAGTWIVTLSATNRYGTGTATLTITITGMGSSSPAASLSPASLTFASEPVGATSAAQAVMVANGGNAPLSISSIALTGTNPGDFAQTNNCGSSVAAGAICTISVTFKPTATGTRTAGITLTDNASGSPQTVSLSGTGGSSSPAASLSPASLTFGNEPLGVSSSSQVITLKNTGSAALSITSIAFTGAAAADFTEVDTCGASVAAGGSCTIAILFTPLASGARVASLAIADNASGSPLSAALSGTGTHDVILTWTASVTSGIAGYYVYRGTAAGGESSTPLNSTPLNATTYTDLNVAAGTSYYYVVTAVAADGVTQSAGSNESSATIPSP